MPLKRPPPVSLAPPPPGPAQAKEGGEGRKEGWSNSGSWFVINGEMKIGQGGMIKKRVAPMAPTPKADNNDTTLSGLSQTILEDTAEMADIHPDDLEGDKRVGSGASGVVSLVRHKKTGHPYAVKVIHFGTIVDKDMLEQEIRQLELSSRFVVRAFTAFMKDKSLHIVQEFMDLGSLADVLKKLTVVPEEVLRAIAFQLFSGLNELHNGVHRLHRDLKPGNLLVNSLGEVKIADFGIATTTNTVGKSTFVGTTTYMSPERIKGDRYGTASDVWSAGLLLVECALGRFPFTDKANFIELLLEITSTERVTLPDSISPEAKDFLWSCMCQNPAQRPFCGQLLMHPWFAIAYQGWSIELHPSTPSRFKKMIWTFLLIVGRFGKQFPPSLAVSNILPYLTLPYDYCRVVSEFFEGAGLKPTVL